MATTFIYALCEPGTRTVRYIGKADNPNRRFQNHLNGSIKAKTRLGNWLRSLKGEKPSLIVLREVPVEQWELAEERYIRLGRGCRMDLVNTTEGGDGGYIAAAHTPEARKKRSTTMKGRRPCEAFFINGQTPEAKAKRIAALKGRKPCDRNRDAHFQNKRPRATSEFLGASWHKRKRKWQARIFVGGKTVSLSYFNDEEEAARAYDTAALKFFGPTTRLNFMV